MKTCCKFTLAALLSVAALAETVEFRQRCLSDLVGQVDAILKSQDKATGRFGKGIWIVNDQNVLLPLAAAWSWRDPRNPWHRSREVLDAIMAGGDALIADQNAIGKWVFRKKDGSTWGDIYMPWTYSRWVRAYQIVRDAMPAVRREKWDRALLLGYSGIAKELASGRIHNIPAHHAMGLYFAGQVFENPEWRTFAREFLRKVAAAQHPDGYWSEHKGPVVSYGFVYVDALGTYAAVSKDPEVLPALRKSALFHANFTYPDGTDVETIDERNPYHERVRVPNPGFTFTPEGRSYVARQLANHTKPLGADEAATLLLWGQEGEGVVRSGETGDFDYVLGTGDAAVRRRGPWFLVVSAMTSPLPLSRWIQDRQNFISVYHDRAGLILGGGNTKLQPRWSNFTAGDISAFKHRPGDENPNFRPPDGVVHIPETAALLKGGDFGVEMRYGSRRATVTLKVAGPDRLEYVVAGDPALTAHLTVLPEVKEPVLSQQGRKAALDGRGFAWTAADAGGWIQHRNVRLSVPSEAVALWPVLPHNPYRKDGSAELAEGRIVLDVPLRNASRTVVVNVLR